jgi:hypothetical protein
MATSTVGSARKKPDDLSCSGEILTAHLLCGISVVKQWTIDSKRLDGSGFLRFRSPWLRQSKCCFLTWNGWSNGNFLRSLHFFSSRLWRVHGLQPETEGTGMLPCQEAPAATLSNNSTPVARGDPSKPPRSCRAKRIWADVATQFNVDSSVIERLIFRGVLKLYDPRVTEKSLTRFCARYGALIKTDFLDAETRDWLAGSMDLAPAAGKDEAGGLEAFRKRALVVRTCKRCGKAIRGNVFFRHTKRCLVGVSASA